MLEPQNFDFLATSSENVCCIFLTIYTIQSHNFIIYKEPFLFLEKAPLILLIACISAKEKFVKMNNIVSWLFKFISMLSSTK